MGFDDGKIVFNNPNGTYLAGQTISGKFIFPLTKAKSFRGIYIRMKGACQVRWTVTRSKTVDGKRETITEVYQSNETYYDRKIYLVGGENGEHSLQKGNHEYVFECQLPSNCPSSFESTIGHIWYDFEVIMDRALNIDLRKYARVNVIAPLDLNADPYCANPMLFDFEKSYCCWCVNAGICETEVKLPASGYYPGQVIPIEVNCNNRSNVEIKTIKFAIKKKTTYHAVNLPAEKSSVDTLSEIKKGPVPGHTVRNWTVELMVPSVDIYNVSACRYIDIEYMFKVAIKPSGCHKSTSQSRRLVLGSVPLISQDSTTSSIPNQIQMPVPSTQSSFHSNTGYPNNVQPYPQTTPYPTSPFPMATNSPVQTALFPNTAPYSPNVQGYPNSPMPSNPPYPNTPMPSNAPYPSISPPYSASSPYPVNTTPYPVQTTAYPVTNPPYPTSAPYPPTSAPNPGHKDGASMPLLSPHAGVPYPTNPNPYVSANAPILETS